MANQEQEQNKDIPSVEFDKDNNLNDYQFLVQKLKIIKENITLLEKHFLEHEK